MVGVWWSSFVEMKTTRTFAVFINSFGQRLRRASLYEEQKLLPLILASSAWVSSLKTTNSTCHPSVVVTCITCRKYINSFETSWFRQLPNNTETSAFPWSVFAQSSTENLSLLVFPHPSMATLSFCVECLMWLQVKEVGAVSSILKMFGVFFFSSYPSVSLQSVSFLQQSTLSTCRLLLSPTVDTFYL